MKIFPYDRFKIATMMTPEAIIGLLKAKIEPRKLFRFSSNHTTFEGNISQEGFEIRRIIHYRNSFLPVIFGKFRPKASGTEVIIKMRPHGFVIAFMCVWFGGVGLFGFIFFLGVLSGKTSLFPTIFILIGMLVFGWALVSGGFWFEVRKQKPMLIEMLKDLDG
ncbi:MAG: hypothetical protein WCS27_00405 [Victivallaceae bacterium]